MYLKEEIVKSNFFKILNFKKILHPSNSDEEIAFTKLEYFRDPVNRFKCRRMGDAILQESE